MHRLPRSAPARLQRRTSSTPDTGSSVPLTAQYRAADAPSRSRVCTCSIGAPASATPATFTCGGSGTSFPGQFITGTGTYTLGGAPGTFTPYNGNVNAYNFGPLNYYQRPDERYTLGAFGRYEINDKAEVFGQLIHGTITGRLTKLQLSAHSVKKGGKSGNCLVLSWCGRRRCDLQLQLQLQLQISNSVLLQQSHFLQQIQQYQQSSAENKKRMYQ